MLPKYLFYLAFGTFLLSGCGLETDEDSDEESDSVTSVQVEVEQNAYLPLTNATTLFYSLVGAGDPGGLETLVTYDISLSNSKGYSVYRLALQNSSLNLDLYFRSTTNNIQLIGIDGPVTLDDVSVDNLRFATPVNLIGNTSSRTINATADLAGSLSADDAALTINYSLSNNTDESFTSDDNNWVFPTLRAELDMEITLTAIGGDPMQLDMTFDFTKGLGIVSHSAVTNDAADAAYEIRFYDLDKLPNIIVFNQDGTEALGTSMVFSLADPDTASDTPITSTDYVIVNQNELDDLGWLTVDVGSITADAFDIQINDDPELPSDLTSVQVLFKKRNSEERLSANVTLLAL